MNTLHGRRMAGPEKEHSISEEAPALGGIAALAIDCTDPPGLAHWWRCVLGGAVEVHPQGYATLYTPEGLALDFLPVPEPKTGKNRLHLDVRSLSYTVERLGPRRHPAAERWRSPTPCAGPPSSCTHGWTGPGEVPLAMRVCPNIDKT